MISLEGVNAALNFLNRHNRFNTGSFESCRDAAGPGEAINMRKRFQCSTLPMQNIRQWSNILPPKKDFL
jgi:hypothetical protein